MAIMVGLPSFAMSCDLGNGTSSATPNSLKIQDLPSQEKYTSVWRETRRGRPDALVESTFGRASNQSYCSSIKKTTRQFAGTNPERNEDANPSS